MRRTCWGAERDCVTSYMLRAEYRQPRRRSYKAVQQRSDNRLKGPVCARQEVIHSSSCRAKQKICMSNVDAQSAVCGKEQDDTFQNSHTGDGNEGYMANRHQRTATTQRQRRTRRADVTIPGWKVMDGRAQRDSLPTRQRYSYKRHNEEKYAALPRSDNYKHTVTYTYEQLVSE